MEILAIIAALGAGAHYLNKEDVPDNAIHSSQTTQEISNFGTLETLELLNFESALSV